MLRLWIFRTCVSLTKANLANLTISFRLCETRKCQVEKIPNILNREFLFFSHKEPSSICVCVFVYLGICVCGSVIRPATPQVAVEQRLRAGPSGGPHAPRRPPGVGGGARAIAWQGREKGGVLQIGRQETQNWKPFRFRVYLGVFRSYFFGLYATLAPSPKLFARTPDRDPAGDPADDPPVGANGLFAAYTDAYYANGPPLNAEQ